MVSCQNRYIVDNKTPLPKVYPDSSSDYLLRQGDMINISFRSTNENLNKFFSDSKENSAGNESKGFEVDAAGGFDVPVLGRITAKGKTISQIQDTLQNIIDAKFIDAIISARMMNFDVYFLGETKQSVQNFNKTSVNILEALAQAGGIEQTGRIKKVMIVRKVAIGHEVFRINLKDRQILTAANFYLKPGDIVYVEPKIFSGVKYNIQTYTLLLSLATSTITTIYLVKQLK